jgi:hypothetical protein
MSPSLTPALALDYLRELSADVRAGVVLGRDGARLAGDPALAAPAAALIAAMGDAAEAEARSPRGAVLAARAGELAVVLACGPRALGGLARHDLRLVLGDLGAPPGGAADAAFAPPPALADAVLRAVERAPGR